VNLVANVFYRLPDADVFATYLPSTDFCLKLNVPAEALVMSAESLMRARVSGNQITDGVREFRPPGALLAFEGFRIDWKVAGSSVAG
jgi:hypothetical protein